MGVRGSNPVVDAPSVLFGKVTTELSWSRTWGLIHSRHPAQTSAGVGVKGNVWVTPQESVPVGLSGKITGFPSAEVYQHRPDGTVSTITQHRATGADWGPALNLPLGLNTPVVGSSGPAKFIPYGETPPQSAPGS